MKKIMNIKRQARGGFTNTRDEDLLVQAETVYAAMDGNPNFPSPDPDLADIRAALDDYSQKLAAARKRGGPEQTALKDKSRSVLQELLKRLAFYVSNTAAGDLSVLLSSGFRPTAYPSGGIPPEVITGLRLRDGRQSGHLVLSFAPDRQALFYEYRFGTRSDEEVEPQWGENLLTTSSRNNVVAPVKAGVRYYVQVRAVNAHGVSDWSEPVSLLAR